MSRGSEAWKLRKEGWKWIQIAEKLGFNFPANAYRAAKNSPLGKEQWPPKPSPSGGERAYKIRLTARVKWSKIAEICHYSFEPEAYKAARAYALRNNKRWPLPGFLSKGEIIYEDMADGVPLKEIMEDHGFVDNSRSRRIAYKYAKRHNKVWPPQLT